MKIREAMTKNPCWVKPETSARELAQKMKEFDIGFIPIGNGEKLLGTVTDRDLILSFAAGSDLDTQASDLMSADVFYCYQEEDITSASKSMEELQIRRLIVLDNESSKKMIGIVTLGDIANRTHDKRLCGEIIEMVSRKAA